MQNTIITCGLYSINEIAVQLQRNYRTIKKILLNMVALGEVETSRKLINGRKVECYNITEDVRKNLYKELGKVTNANTNVQVSSTADITGMLNTVADTNMQLERAKSSIATLQAEINKKDIQILQLQADKDKSELQIRYITDKQTSIEGANAQLQKDITILNTKIKQKNYIILGVSAILLVFVAVVLTLSIR